MAIAQILKESLERNASDVILSSESKPALKINWDVTYLDNYEVYKSNILKEELFSIMNEKQRRKLEENFELDFSIDLKSYSRFRVNVFYSKNWVGAVFRPIKTILPDFESLGLPEKLLELIKKPHGLLLVTWSVGSGKSTTMSALIDHITRTQKKHIITVEDPIEFVFSNNQSLVEQREVETNTKSFENGLKYALREASDVIMIGEMRDIETFRLALRAAETWNLVIATLHTSWASRTISRIVDMFPWDEKDQVRTQLADSLLWVIWQQLLKNKAWDGRVLATELLVNNTGVSNMIRKWVLHQIEWAMETWAADWMYTMEANLEKLREKGSIE